VLEEKHFYLNGQIAVQRLTDDIIGVVYCLHQVECLSHSTKLLILSNSEDTLLGFLLRPNSVSEKLNWLIGDGFM
jgi:hypothetical protein